MTTTARHVLILIDRGSTSVLLTRDMTPQQDSEESDTSDSDNDQPRRAPAPKKKGEAEKAEECKNQ